MKKFPCPICKGSGILEEGTTVDVGLGTEMQVSPDIECGYCEGDGMIVVRGDLHKKRVIERLANELIWLYKAEEYNWEQHDVEHLFDDAIKKIALKQIEYLERGPLPF